MHGIDIPGNAYNLQRSCSFIDYIVFCTLMYLQVNARGIIGESLARFQVISLILFAILAIMHALY